VGDRFHKLYGRERDADTDGFQKMFPTSTKRSGLIRPNSARVGRGQGRDSSHRFVHCQICGYVFDKNRVDHAGGDLSGNGGLGAVTKTVKSGTLLNGTEFTETVGEQTVQAGGGCPHCGTKNGVRRADEYSK